MYSVMESTPGTGCLHHLLTSNQATVNRDVTKAIWEHIDTLDTDPTSDAASRQCVTIEADSAESWGSFWIQLHAGHINFLHLDDPRKDEVLGMILDPVDTLDEMELEPGGFVMFDLTSLTRSVIDGLLSRLIHEYFRISENEALHISDEEI